MKDLLIPNNRRNQHFFSPRNTVNSLQICQRQNCNKYSFKGRLDILYCMCFTGFFFFFFEMLGVTECKISSHKNKYIQYREVYGKFFFYSFSLLLIYYPFGGLAQNLLPAFTAAFPQFQLTQCINLYHTAYALVKFK